MTVRTPVLCYYCGGPILSLQDGLVQWLSSADNDTRLEGVTLVHAFTAPNKQLGGCTYHERKKAGSIQDHPAEVFVDYRGLQAQRLRKIARDGAHHYKFCYRVTKIFHDVRKLAALSARKESVVEP